MRKTKEILAFLLVLAMILLNVNMVFAADKLTATTTTEGGATVKWQYELEGDNIVNLVCTNISEIAGKVEIPSTIDGKTVLELGYTAFSKCYGMTEVTLPDTLTYIGSSAFEHCIGLKSITIPDKVNFIGEGAFKKCTGLKEVNLSKNLTALKQSIFEGCKGITTIVIPDNVTSLFDYCFWNCKGLKSVVIPENVSTIEAIFWNISKDNITIYGVKGSYAEEWAKEKGYTFDVIENYNPNGSKNGIVTNNTQNQDKTNDSEKSNGSGTTSGTTGDSTGGTTSGTTSGTTGGSTGGTTSGTTGGSTGGTTSGTTGGSTGGTTSGTTKSDATTAKKVLPNTGKNIAIFGVIALVIVLGIAGAAKYYKMKDIK